MKNKVIFTILILAIILLNLSTLSKAEDKEISNFSGFTFSNIREEIKLNDKTILAVGTATSLYLLENHNIISEFILNQEAIFIEPIKDMNGNGFDELLIITNSTNQDNILLYDTESNELIYQYASKMHAYNDGDNKNKPIGYYDEYVVVEDYIVKGDYFYGVAGYNAFSIDLKNQKLLWSYQAENNLWDIENIGDINKDNREDVVVSLQTTDIIALSGKNGEKIYQESISEPVVSPRNNSDKPTSIWSMQFDEETNVLYAASENGKIYQVNPINGKIVEKQAVGNAEFLKQGYNSSNYLKKYSIELIDDITDDGVKDLIYYEMTRPFVYISNYYHNSFDSYIILIDGKSLTELEIKIPLVGDIVYGIHYFRGMYDNESVIYVLNENIGDSISYKIFSLNQKAYLDEEISINSKDYMIGYKHSLSVLSNQEIALFSDFDLTFQKDNFILKKINLIKSENYMIDGNRLLLFQGLYRDRGYFNFKMIDIDTDSTIWNFKLNDEEVSESIKLDFTHDFNQDGFKDVVLLNLSGNGTKLPWVMFIDGKTGKVEEKINVGLKEEDVDFSMYSSFQSYMESLGYSNSVLNTFGFYNDVNYDGVNEFYVTNNMGELYIIDIYHSKIINYYSPNNEILYQSESHYLEYDFTMARKVNDIDGDSLYDFIQISNNDNETILCSIKTNNGVFDIETIGQYPESNISNYNQFGDIDGDGINDYVFESYKDYHIISSKTGEVLVNFEYKKYEEYCYLSDEDINGDGIKEVFHVKYDYEQNKSFVLLYDVSEGIPQVIFTSPGFQPNYSGNYTKPAVVYSYGGSYYLAIQTEVYTYETTIYIYDLSIGQLVDTIHFQLEDTHWNHSQGLSLGNIGFTKDGDDIYFYPVKLNYYNVDINNMKMNTEKGLVYNYSKNKTFFYANGLISKLDVINGKVILKDVYSQVIKTNIESGIKFKSLKDNQKINKKLTLDFLNKEEGIVYIYVDNVLVGITDKDYYELRLLEGKHEISISQINSFGIETMETIHVEVTKNYFYTTVVIVITVSLFASGIILPRRKKRYDLINDQKGSDE